MYATQGNAHNFHDIFSGNKVFQNVVCFRGILGTNILIFYKNPTMYLRTIIKRAVMPVSGSGFFLSFFFNFENQI